MTNRSLPGCAVSSDLVEQQIRDMLGASLRAVIQTNESMEAADFRAELRRLTVPVLVVHGEHDASAPLELTGRRTAELIPGRRVVVYRYGPHGLYLTHRDQLTADLLDFAAGHDHAAHLHSTDRQRGGDE